MRKDRLISEISERIKCYSVLFNDFEKWLVKLNRSKNIVRNYSSYIRRPLDLSKRHSVLAYRVFIRFLYESGIDDLTEHLQFLKVGRAGIDTYVPSEEKVLNDILRINREDIRAVYLLLITSGLRLSETLLALRILNRDGLVKVDRCYRLKVEWLRGTKKVFYAYFPADIIGKLMHVRLSSDAVSRYAIRYDIVRPKYIRKFVATKMFQLGIRSEAIDFIQGRVPRSILAKHYLNLLSIADKEYLIYGKYVTSILKAKEII